MKVKGILNRRFFHEKWGKKIIHVEAPHLTEKELLNHIKKYRSKCYCITPANYNYVKGNFGFNGNEKEFKDSLKKIYLKLKEMKIKLEPHIHLSLYPEKMNFNEKEKLIKEVFQFFINDLKVIPKEVVFGWTKFDPESIEIVRKLNARTIKDKHFHIYDFWLIKRGKYEN